ncbi:MAG: Na+/H+ antiporter NhaA [Eggerthellaceae bacterium]|nr:Na+/H+ antiporter NhaA [Eggerthellaceae bacterium]
MAENDVSEIPEFEEGSEEQKEVIRKQAASVYTEESRKNQRRFGKLLTLAYSSTKAAGIMLVAAIAALIIANTPAMQYFELFLEFKIGFVIGETQVSMPVAEIINDIFMAIFFLLVGLEIKYEMTAGELTNIRQALLPIIAAFGGVLAPIVIYSIFNAAHPDSAHGWGVPTATDIAFALGILALLGNRVPNGVRVFLSTLAVADDIIAIVVIAVFYGQTPSLFGLACAGGVMVVLFVMNRLHIYALTPYLLVGVVLWYCVFMSGVHSTIAGVLLAFTSPSGSRVSVRNFLKWSDQAVEHVKEAYKPEVPVSSQGGYLEMAAVISKVTRQTIPPATRLERKLYPWVYFGILPLFALTNADVSFVGSDIGAMITSPVFFGVFLGLLVGKPVGIMLFSFVVIKTKLASLPENVNWMHMLGAAILGGVGFTMAIFVANLAFPAHPELITNAKVAILSASTLAGVIGFIFLMLQAKAAAAKGVAYLTTTAPQADRQTAGAEAARKSADLIDSIESPLMRQEIEAAQNEHANQAAEVVVELGSEDEE